MRGRTTMRCAGWAALLAACLRLAADGADISKVRGLKPKLAPAVDGAFRDIPIEVSPKTRRAIVKASVNGVEGRFLLDTGLSDTILDLEFARKAGADFVEICMPIVAGNYGKKGDTIAFVRVADLEMAGTHFRDFHAVYRDNGGSRGDFDGRLDGTIGANVLFAMPLRFDYRQQTLSFATNTTGPHDFVFDLAPRRRKTAPKAKINEVSSETAAVEAEIDGFKVRLMLDSGAAINDAILVNEPYHAALRKLAGNPDAKEYRAQEVRVGSSLLLTDQQCLLRPFEETVIGSFFFDRHVITVDLAARKIWIDRNP